MFYPWTNRIDIPGCNQQEFKFYYLSYYHVNSDENLVLNRSSRFFYSQVILAFACLAPILITAGKIVFSTRITKVSEVKNYSIDEKRDIYSTFDTEDEVDKGLPIDPFDLMNRLKKAGAMNNATTPSDALDEALNAFDDSEY